jgi:hypothetical protein
MPPLSRFTVRASLIYMFLGFSLGGIMLANEGLRWNPSIDLLVPVHVDLLLYGWLAQLILGVAYWILPRTGAGRGSLAVALAAAALLNLGTVVLVMASLSLWPSPAPTIGMSAVAGGGVLFAFHAWPRLRRPSHRRG